MKYFALVFITLLLLITSCSDLDKSIAFQELEQAEYTRKVNDQKTVRWLNNGDADIRLKAVKTLGRIQDTSKVVLLANRLTDEDPRVRSEAVFALGQLFSPEAENYLIEALHTETDKEVRLKAIEALGKSGTNKNPDIFRSFIDGGDRDYQKAAAVACAMLAYRGYHPHQLAPDLSKLMASTRDPEVAWRCAYALYRIGSLGSFYDFAKALELDEPLAKYYGLKGISHVDLLINAPQFNEHRNEKAYRDLLNRYNSRDFRNQLVAQLQDSTWYVRIAALELFGNMEENALQKEIVKMLDDPHPNVRIQAIRSLANYKNWYTRREMRRIYSEEEDWRIKGEALAVLALIEPGEALENVKKDLIEQPWPENYYAVKTLENIETTNERNPVRETDEATQLLMQLADNENIAQTTMVLEVLVNRSKPPSIDFFLDQLNTGDMAVATIVSTYLALIKAPKPVQAVPPLIQAYNNFSAPRDLEAMEPILAALDSIGSEEAVPFLRRQLENPYPAIRERALRALRHIAPEENIRIPETREAYATKWDFKRLNPDSSYYITFSTNRGDFTVEVYPGKSPVNVANIVSLVKQNFYRDIYFHRVVPGFVVQAGDPRGDGWGGPGYSIPCEYNDIFYDRGTVGMALAGKDTGSSQFFVTHTPQPQLNGRYTVLGKVVSGMDVVDRLMIFDRILGAEITVSAKH